MILEIDAGNTRIKWRLLDGGTDVRDSGACTSPAELSGDIAAISHLIERVRMVSVRSRPVTEQMCAALTATLGITPELARTAAAAGGVTNSYSDPGSMGVDRWLLMLAAWNKVQDACCVVSCGTAMTVDVLDSAGLHGGGYIFPGLSLQRRSLLQNTSIPLEADVGWQADWSALTLGRSTGEAVNHGIFACVVRALAGIPELAGAAKQGRLFLAGGDAGPVASGLLALGFSARCEPELVLDGLRFALP